jgi:hypothetical protein
MEGKAFADEALQAELERRLEEMNSPGYQDPAREDWRSGDFLALAAFVLVICGAFLVWGY